jgi:hypothetical protein
MIGRTILSVFLIAVLPGLNFYLHQTLVPDQSTDLALQQLNEDGARETLRAMEQMSNWIDFSLVAIGIAGIGIIWTGKIRELLRIR